MERRHYGWLLVLIMVTGLSLRVIGINWGLPSKTETLHTFHPDEAIILSALSNMNPSRLDFNPQHFYAGNFHFYLTGFVLKMCSFLGLVVLDPSGKKFYRYNFSQMDRLFLIGRYIAIFFALFTIYLVYLLGKKLYSEEVGLWSSLFMAITPIHVIDSHYMYIDIPMTFWFTLVVLLSVKIYETSSIRWYFLAGISAALACGTKYYGGLCLLFPIYAHLMREGPKALISKKILLIISSFILTFLLTNPYLILAYQEAKKHIFQSSGLAFGSESIEVIKDNNLLLYPMLMSYALGIPLLVSSILGIILALIKVKKANSILLFAFFSYYIPISLVYTKMEHALIPITPLLAIFTTNFLLLRKGYLWKMMMEGILLYTALYSWGYVDIMANRDTRLLASRWIEDNIPAGTKIGVIEHFYSPPIIYSHLRLMPEKEPQTEYNTILIPYDIEKLRSEQPEYFIINDFLYCEDYQAFWKKGDVEAKKRFLDYLMNSGAYIEIKRFVEYPSIFGLKLDPRRPPWHTRYIKPEIIIFIIKREE